MSDKPTDPYRASTHLIHGRMRSDAWEYDHHVVPPISTSTTFRLDSTYRGAQGFQEFAHSDQEGHHIYIYDRLGEPNKDLLEERLAAVEGGETAVSFASGMGAISAVLGTLLRSGEHLVAHRMVYGCTHSLLHNWFPRYGIDVTHVDLRDPSVLLGVVRPETRVVYFETPVNPNIELLDIALIAAVVAKENARRAPEERMYVVVDNTFATPFCQRPIMHGADFVVHSLTKGLSGFGTEMGGVVIGPQAFRDSLLMYRKDFGAVLSPRSAWSIMVYGLPSLSIRMRQSQESAMQVARYLEEHAAVEKVMYPGLPGFPGHALARRQMRNFEGEFAPGSMLFFELTGTSPADRQMTAVRFMNHIAREAYTITLAVSLGHVRTLVEHPSSMTHATIPPEEQVQMGLPPSGIRLSIGLEDPRDLMLDLEEALQAATRAETAV